jgi:DNA invertase Pin-like site-specific DNA recombinase
MTTLKSPTELLLAAPQRRKAYSLVRFSTPQQALGDSARRQYARTIAYCEEHNLELVETIRDEGMSGFHGIHRKRGAFGRFVRRFLKGEIASDGVFIAEAFDRFTREPPRKAQQLFLSLINGDENTNGGLEVVTLIDGRRYSADSIDRNVGELFTSIGLMLGAHMESKNKGDRIHEGWDAPKTGRRYGGMGKQTGLPNNIYPAWIVKTPEGPKLDKAKAKVLHRIRTLLPTMGLEAIAKLLNDEGIPPLNCRKRPGRAVPLWDKTTVHKIIRGRQVRGEQAIGRYQDVKDATTGEVTFKRVLTGAVNQDAYPAVFTQAEWLTANHILDTRKRGVQTGRNVTAYSNLYGDIAVCDVCGGRMKIRGKGRLHGKKYLGCSNAGLHGCSNSQYYRLDKIDADTFKMIGVIPMPDNDDTGETDRLAAQLATAKRDADELQRRIDRLAEAFGDAPAAIKASMLKLADEHAQKQASMTALERRLAMLRSHNPREPLADAKLVVRSGAGKVTVEHRRQIAALLPRLFREFRFGSTITATLTDGRGYKLGQFMPAGPIALGGEDGLKT